MKNTYFTWLFCFFSISTLFITTSAYCQQPAFDPGEIEGTSWATVVQEGEGRLLILYRPVKPFYYTDEMGRTSGIEYELVNYMIQFINKKYQVNVEPIWIDIEIENKQSLKATFQNLKNGAIALTAMPIDNDWRSTGIYSIPYMRYKAGIVSHVGTPIAEDKNQLRNVLNGHTIFTVKGSDSEKQLLTLKADLFPDSEIKYAASDKDVSALVASTPNSFSFMPLYEYYLALKNGKELNKQPYVIGKEGFAMIYPQSSDWTEPFKAYFEAPNFKANSTIIVKKHLGLDAEELTWGASEKDTDSTQEESPVVYNNSITDSGSFSLLAAGAGLAIGLLVLLAVFLKLRKDHQKALSKLKADLHQAKLIADKVEEELSDELFYTNLVVRQLQPDEEQLAQIFKESFVFYAPRDKVSGDFYFVARHEHRNLVLIIDSTTRGADSAFLLQTCNNILQELTRNGIATANQLLSTFDKKLHRAMLLEGGSFVHREGADAALCIFDTQQQLLEFAGAKLNAHVISKGQIQQLKGSKFKVGNDSFEEKVFDLEQIKYQSGDMVYLATDGFADQLGSDKKRKYLPRHFREFLFEISDQTMRTQQSNLKRELYNWKGTVKQTDDILVFGLRLP